MEQLYSYLLKYMLENNLVQASMVSSQEVICFYDEKPEFFILPNGSLFISESLLSQIIEVGGVESLAYVILHELSHLARGHLRQNLMENIPYGDLKRQLMFFKTEYTGYDALFIDHFTNTRYTRD